LRLLVNPRVQTLADKFVTHEPSSATKEVSLEQRAMGLLGAVLDNTWIYQQELDLAAYGCIAHDSRRIFNWGAPGLYSELV
jgi:hypothetical protein